MGGYRKRNMLGVDHCQEEKQQCKKTISEGVRHYDIGVSEVSRGLGKSQCVGGIQGRLQVEQELSVMGVVRAESREAVRPGQGPL